MEGEGLIITQSFWAQPVASTLAYFKVITPLKVTEMAVLGLYAVVAIYLFVRGDTRGFQMALGIYMVAGSTVSIVRMRQEGADWKATFYL